jgi:predicted PurR-regulated permease PerM
MNNRVEHRVDISYKTILFIAGFAALVWALSQIIEVIVLLFIAIILMSALSPIVEYLEKVKLPSALAIGVVYLLVIAVIAGLISLIVTPLIDQTSHLFETLPQLSESLAPLGVDQSLIKSELNDFSKNALSFTLAIFSNFIALISVLVLTFYLLLERGRVDELISQFFIGREERVRKITNRVEDKLGAWMRGQIALSLIIGVMAYVVLFALQIPYALPLAILAGLFEVVPTIGPIISSLPAILVAYFVSPFLAVIVGISFFVIQQLENHIIVPQVMKKAVGLNPLIVILAVAIGGKLLGIAGALLAVPITVVIQIITEDVLREDKS